MIVMKQTYENGNKTIVVCNSFKSSRLFVFKQKISVYKFGMCL